MNLHSKSNIAVFCMLCIESFCFTVILLSTDKDINGIRNAFSVKFLLDYIVIGAIFLTPLFLLYTTLVRRSFKFFLAWLFITGIIMAGLLSLLGGSAGEYNRSLHFFYRSAGMIGILAIAIAIAWVAGKFVLLLTRRSTISS